MKIRALEIKDLDDFIEMCAQHAVYEKASFSKEGKEEKFKDLLESKSNWQAFVVEIDQQLVGYCSLVKQFSTWGAEHYLYLDCLFIKEVYRGRKIGSLLMKWVNGYAKEANCNEIQWQTPDFNTDAIRFYNRIGALSKTKERFFWTV